MQIIMNVSTKQSPVIHCENVAPSEFLFIDKVTLTNFQSISFEDNAF